MVRETLHWIFVTPIWRRKSFWIKLYMFVVVENVYVTSIGALLVTGVMFSLYINIYTAKYAEKL